jgi:hypothetical protein
VSFDTTAVRTRIREVIAAQRYADGIRQMNMSQMMASRQRLREAGDCAGAAAMYLHWIKAQGWI